MRVAALFLFLFLLVPWTAGAQTLALDRQLSLEFQMPGARWVFSRKAPEMLVAQSVRQIEGELRAKGQQVPRSKVETLARKRLARNEAFVFDPHTGANLVIDFSPLRPDESPPSDQDVATSASYAGDSLTGERGVVGARPEIARVTLSGARVVFRLRATYQQDGVPKSFTGLIGYAHPYWFYFYYTDPLKEPADAREMERLLHSLVLHRMSRKK